MFFVLAAVLAFALPATWREASATVVKKAKDFKVLCGVARAAEGIREAKLEVGTELKKVLGLAEDANALQAATELDVAEDAKRCIAEMHEANLTRHLDTKTRYLAKAAKDAHEDAKKSTYAGQAAAVEALYGKGRTAVSTNNGTALACPTDAPSEQLGTSSSNKLGQAEKIGSSIVWDILALCSKAEDDCIKAGSTQVGPINCSTGNGKDAAERNWKHLGKACLRDVTPAVVSTVHTETSAAAALDTFMHAIITEDDAADGAETHLALLGDPTSDCNTSGCIVYTEYYNGTDSPETTKDIPWKKALEGAATQARHAAKALARAEIAAQRLAETLATECRQDETAAANTRNQNTATQPAHTAQDEAQRNTPSHAQPHASGKAARSLVAATLATLAAERG